MAQDETLCHVTELLAVTVAQQITEALPVFTVLDRLLQPSERFLMLLPVLLVGLQFLLHGSHGLLQQLQYSTVFLDPLFKTIHRILFPKQWTLFAPVSKNFLPTAAQLETIPATLDGVKGKNELLQANEFDFAQVIGRQQEEQCGWAFAELNSPIDCDYTIGAGADWWMTYYVNGKKVIDTTGIGNQKYPYLINNHLATVRLKKGKNILAVKLITGRKSSTLMLGGPNDLRNLSSKLKVAKTAEWPSSIIQFTELLNYC